MSDELRKCLSDMLVAAAEIESFVVKKKDFSKFKRTPMLRAAVERKIEIIGEAMSNALKLEPALPITHARRIVGTRNKIIHGYDEVDEVMIGEIVVKHLPVLCKEVEHLLLT